MAINPEDFKVNKTTTDVNTNRRAKFANKQGFDCQDCDNVVSADATGQNIIFTNYIDFFYPFIIRYFLQTTTSFTNKKSSPFFKWFTIGSYSF